MTSSAATPLKLIPAVAAGACMGVVRERRGAHAWGERRSCELGTTQIHVYRTGQQQNVPITVSEAMIVFAIATAGSAECVALDRQAPRRCIGGPAVMLLARPGRSNLIWHEGSEGVLLRLPRTSLQILAGARSGQALRIAATDAVVNASDEMVAIMTRLAAWVWTGRGMDREQDDWRSAIHASIVDGLLGGADWNCLTVVSRAAQQVLTALGERVEGPLDLDRFAASHGITLRTLREAVSACFGKSLSAFVQEARLRYARERLSSGFESRAIQAIAEAAGFQNASSFARAYSRCFGESPTQTRARSIEI
jgi:AraC-like DNA-binding protein